MDDRRSSNSSSYNRYSYEGYGRGSGPASQYDQRRSLDTSQHQTYRRRSPLTNESETITYGSDIEEDDDEDNDEYNSWDPRRSASGSPKTSKDKSPRDRGKGKEPQTSNSSRTTSRMGESQYGNDRERTTGSQNPDRRNETSRTSTSSNTQTSSRQGSEDARGERTSRSERTGGSGSNRSRLVSGVFVRY